MLCCVALHGVFVVSYCVVFCGACVDGLCCVALLCFVLCCVVSRRVELCCVV